jgi:short-subunit dehydrogenase
MRLGSGTVAVVTGAASGIGRALARQFHERGVRVALVDVDGPGIDALASGLSGSTIHVCDVSDPAAVSACSDEVIRAHGGVHVLVNNAGISAAGAVDELPLEVFHRAMDVNFWGVVHTTRAFLPELRRAAAGGAPAGSGALAGSEGLASICNVLSDFALFSLPTKAAYAASKHAARALTEALGAELHGTGIVVTAAYPGATATNLLSRGHAVDEVKRRREAEFLEKGLAPEIVARRIVRGIEAGRIRVLIGRDTRAIDLAARLAPGFVQAGVRRLWRRVPFL